jgi:mRNA-degrading endonuclease RelE of RelBE toxin-antitoxin system
MTEIKFSKRFLKSYYKLPPKVQIQFKSRLEEWKSDPLSPRLRQHVLSGEYLGYESINVAGDYRALFYRVGDAIINPSST